MVFFWIGFWTGLRCFRVGFVVVAVVGEGCVYVVLICSRFCRGGDEFV